MRLFVTGSILGAAGGLIAITPLGRISGAHLNPAISLGFFAEGKMQLLDLFGYIIAQLGGGIVGAWAGEVASGGFGRSVHEAVNLPARGVSNSVSSRGWSCWDVLSGFRDFRNAKQ